MNENPLTRRINYRNFKKDVYPSRDVVTKIIQDAIIYSPFKGSMKYLDIDVWGPEHSKIKSEFVLSTPIAGTGLKKHKNKHLDFDEWDKKLEEEYKKYPYKFNTQVEAPYLLAFIENRNRRAYKFRPDKSVYARWGMFMYSVVLFANNYGIDASYCGCFHMKRPNKNNKMCLDYRKDGKEVLSFIGLGYYDFDRRELNWKRRGEDYIEHDQGGKYNIKNRERIGCKSNKYKIQKPTIDSMLRWR